MSAIVIEGLLAITVMAVWLGCAGFSRLRTPFDRMHCVTFVNATAWVTLTAAAFTADGASSRALKILAITLLNLLAGAAMSHATGRALLLRGVAADPDMPASLHMTLLVVTMLLLVAATGTGVALSRTPRRQVLAMAANGLALALLFMVLQAPDVAFAELAVGTAVLPLLFLVVLASTRMDRAPARRDEQS